MQKKIQDPKEYKRKRRHMHIRNKLAGTTDRPRVCVFRSNTHIYVQIIDDETGRTLVSASSLKLEPPKKAAEKPSEAIEEQDEGKKKGKKKGGKKAKAPAGVKTLQAQEVGRAVAEVAKEKGITKVRFDRGGYLYHGRVAALAQAMREGGLEF
jgi:large subunit ribosomal protein L18